jgi:hypothetical protein
MFAVSSTEKLPNHPAGRGAAPASHYHESGISLLSTHNEQENAGRP